MARYTKPREVEVAEATIERLARESTVEGPLRGTKILGFEAGPDHTGDPSITFSIEFSTSRPEPDLDRIDELEAFIKDIVRRNEKDEYLFVYFRYSMEGDFSPETPPTPDRPLQSQGNA